MSDSENGAGSVEPDVFRRTLGAFPTGVAVITTPTGAGPVGITVNSFTSLSLTPPLVLFCIDENSTRYDNFAHCSHFAVNILREDQAELSMTFASKTHPDWSSVDWHVSAHEGGCPMLDGTLAAIECRRHAMYVEGDHCILIGEAVHATRGTGGHPLLYFAGTYHRIETDGEE